MSSHIVHKLPVNFDHDDIDLGRTKITFRNRDNVVLLMNHDWAAPPLAKVKMTELEKGWDAEFTLHNGVNPDLDTLIGLKRVVELGGRAIRDESGFITEFEVYEVSICLP